MNSSQNPSRESDSTGQSPLTCLFIGTFHISNVSILVYIADILIVGYRQDIATVEYLLYETFRTTDLGYCTHYLPIEIGNSP